MRSLLIAALGPLVLSTCTTAPKIASGTADANPAVAQAGAKPVLLSGLVSSLRQAGVSPLIDPLHQESGSSRGFAAPAIAPLLPWPPPHPSSMGRANELVALKPGLPYVTIDALLRARLTAAGYRSAGYFSIWNTAGFAVLTPLERFEPSGEPVRTGRRFATDKDTTDWTVLDLLKKTFVGEDGKYRMIMIIVSEVPFAPGNFDAEDVDVRRWEGSNSTGWTPPDANLKSTDKTSLTILVYEFTMSKGRIRMMEENRDAPLPIDLHLNSLMH